MHASGLTLRGAPVEVERLAQKKIGYPLRVAFGDLYSFERSLHVGEYGALNRAKEPPHLLANLADIGDMGERAAAELRHFAGKEEIRSAADRDRVEARTAQMHAQCGENLLFVAEVSVGKQDDVTQV